MSDRTSAQVVEILKADGLIDNAQGREIIEKDEAQKKRVLKGRGALRARATEYSDLSVVQVIDSMTLKMPGKEDRFITEEVVCMAIAKKLGMPFVRIDPLKIDADVVTGSISRPFATRHRVVPIEKQGNTLTVATANPFDKEVIENLKRLMTFDLKVVMSPRGDIERIITEFFGFKSSIAAAQVELASDFDLGNLEQYFKLRSISELDASDKHVVKAVEYLLHYAYSQRASDIHIEPKRDNSLVRLRIDGVLHVIHKMPRAVHPAFVSRIKTMARMDIAEKRRPQDGRIKTDYNGKDMELRISTLPVAFGEKVVIRIFDPDIMSKDLSTLGFLKRELDLFHGFINAPYGMILVTGPTGSGKTSTLYCAMRSIASPEVNIVTIEDPVEMVYEDLNQIAVNQQIGVTFGSALRTILRQDPDIIMVGEIRDNETADNAVQSALTGHLVFSTLHTNDAPSSLTRLVDLGVPGFLISASLLGVIAQRLVRKICPSCIDTYNLTADEARSLGLKYESVADRKVSVGMGCTQCRGTGYKGRTGIYEIMEMSDPIKQAVIEKADPAIIRDLARKGGFKSLRECAIQKMFDQITSYEEVIRVVGAAM